MPRRNNIFWKKFGVIAGAVLLIFSIFGGGYGAGIYMGEVDCKLDKMELLVSYQEKLKECHTSDKIEKINSTSKDSKDFDEFIQNLKTIKDEK